MWSDQTLFWSSCDNFLSALELKMASFSLNFCSSLLWHYCTTLDCFAMNSGNSIGYFLTILPLLSHADLSLVPELAMRVKEIPVNPCFALMLAFEEPLPLVRIRSSFGRTCILGTNQLNIPGLATNVFLWAWAMHSDCISNLFCFIADNSLSISL